MRLTRRGFDYRGKYIEIIDDEGGEELGDFVHQAYNKKLFTALEKLAQYEDIDDDPEILADYEDAATWIPCTWREPTEEEAKEQKERWGESFPIATFPVPEDGQDILITRKWWDKKEDVVEYYVTHDTAVNDDGMIGLENNDDYEYVVAWCPLPEPYKEDGEE